MGGVDGRRRAVLVVEGRRARTGRNGVAAAVGGNRGAGGDDQVLQRQVQLERLVRPVARVGQHRAVAQRQVPQAPQRRPVVDGQREVGERAGLRQQQRAVVDERAVSGAAGHDARHGRAGNLQRLQRADLQLPLVGASCKTPRVPRLRRSPQVVLQVKTAWCRTFCCVRAGKVPRIAVFRHTPSLPASAAGLSDAPAIRSGAMRAS